MPQIDEMGYHINWELAMGFSERKRPQVQLEFLSTPLKSDY